MVKLYAVLCSMGLLLATGCATFGGPVRLSCFEGETEHTAAIEIDSKGPIYKVNDCFVFTDKKGDVRRLCKKDCSVGGSGSDKNKNSY